MARFICDSYSKKDKQIWGEDPSEPFNQKILAVNEMYGWLYEQGILEQVSFEFKDYEETAYFALNAADLLPYRKAMEASGLDASSLAVQHIFDEPYSPCEYSGAIELGWTMSSYRDVDGCVGRSWECGLIKNLNTEGIYEVAKVRDEQGIKAALTALFQQFDWNLTLPEQKRYKEALAHFGLEVDANIENEFVKSHAKELLYCYEHDKSLIDFDFWTRYETLCGESMTYNEYLAIDSLFDGDPHDIMVSNTATISELKDHLNAYRANPVSMEQDNKSLSEQLRAASNRSAASYRESAFKDTLERS